MSSLSNSDDNAVVDIRDANKLPKSIEATRQTLLDELQSVVLTNMIATIEANENVNVYPTNDSRYLYI